MSTVQSLAQARAIVELLRGQCGLPLPDPALPEVTFLPDESGWAQWDMATLLLDARRLRAAQ